MKGLNSLALPCPSNQPHLPPALIPDTTQLPNTLVIRTSVLSAISQPSNQPNTSSALEPPQPSGNPPEGIDDDLPPPRPLLTGEKRLYLNPKILFTSPCSLSVSDTTAVPPLPLSFTSASRTRLLGIKVSSTWTPSEVASPFPLLPSSLSSSVSFGSFRPSSLPIRIAQ